MTLQARIAAITWFKAGLSITELLRDETGNNEDVDDEVEDVGAAVGVRILAEETVDDDVEEHVQEEETVERQEQREVQRLRQVVFEAEQSDIYRQQDNRCVAIVAMVQDESDCLPDGRRSV